MAPLQISLPLLLLLLLQLSEYKTHSTFSLPASPHHLSSKMTRAAPLNRTAAALALALLLTAAQDAVAATEGIESIFFSLTAKLAQVDSMGLNGNNPLFEPQLAAIRSVRAPSLASALRPSSADPRHVL